MQDKVLKYSVLFIALVLGAHVLQTLGQVLRPLAIALLLLFVFTPLARYSKEKVDAMSSTTICKSRTFLSYTCG